MEAIHMLNTTQVQEEGYRMLYLNGDGEVMEIFRLTCLEHGVKVSSSPAGEIPTVSQEGTSFIVRWPEQTE